MHFCCVVFHSTLLSIYLSIYGSIDLVDAQVSMSPTGSEGAFSSSPRDMRASFSRIPDGTEAEQAKLKAIADRELADLTAQSKANALALALANANANGDAEDVVKQAEKTVIQFQKEEAARLEAESKAKKRALERRPSCVICVGSFHAAAQCTNAQMHKCTNPQMLNKC